MKKAALLLTTMLMASPALASDFFLKPYAGLDYQYTGVNYEDNIDGTGINGDDIAEDALHGANIHIGARVHKYLGFEAGYLWTNPEDKDNILGTGINSETQVTGFNFDAMGYIPVADKLELIATAGITHLKAEVEFSAPGVGTEAVDDSETGARFGGGAQFWLTERMNARALVRYQTADFDGSAQDAIIGTLGLNYQF